MNWLKNLKIQTKLFIAFGTFIILMFAFAVFSTMQFSRLNATSNNSINRLISLTEAMNRLSLLRLNNLANAFASYEDDLSEAVSGLRDIDYEDLRSRFLLNLEYNRHNILYDNSLSNEEKQHRLSIFYSVEFLFTESFITNSVKIVEGLNAQDHEMVKKSLAAAYETGVEISLKLTELYDTHALTVTARANAVSDNIQRIIYLLIFVAVCIAVLSFVISIYTGKIITAPIGRIEQAMVKISGGDLSHPIRSDFKDELGVLSNRIGDMVDNIVEMNRAVAAIDYLDTMIYVTDMDYNLIYVNRHLADAFGIEHNNFKGKKCYKALRNNDYPCAICQLPLILKRKEEFPSVNYENIWDDVLKIWIGGRASIIRWIDGSTVHYQTINDESEKKQYEENLHKAVLDAETASKSKTAFLANMSHEIRTPMNSIVGFSELALDDDIPDKTRDYLAKIMLNSEWLLQIINDILDISKIESGKMELERIPFDLHELFFACRTIITPKADEKGVNLHFYAEPSIERKLIGDPIRMRQVLINILSNAVKFTNTGGLVKISAVVIGQPNGNITINFEIKDSGIGMTPEQLSKIEEPFTQAEAGITRKYGGTGLGLTISKNIIEMMGGTLNIESMFGVGSKFSFDITFDTVEAERIDTLARVDIGTGAKVRKPLFDSEVLICEDNQMNQQMLCDHLKRIGLRADVAENGREGLNMVRRRVEKGEKPYALIFMDIHMPIMDGLEATEKIIELNTGTPIVAMTANIMSHDQELYRKSGMLDCIGKPFVSQELWRCLLKHLTPVEWQSEDTDVRQQADNRLRQMLIANFLKDNMGKYDEIANAIDSGDIVLAHRLAHTLKSNAAMLDKTGLRKIAEDIEGFLADEKSLVTEEIMKSLESELRAVLYELAPLAEDSTQSPANIEFLSPEKARELLVTLLPLLESGSSECLKYIDALHGIHGSEKLIQEMSDLDFTPAANTLSELLKHF